MMTNPKPKTCAEHLTSVLDKMCYVPPSKWETKQPQAKTQRIYESAFAPDPKVHPIWYNTLEYQTYHWSPAANRWIKGLPLDFQHLPFTFTDNEARVTFLDFVDKQRAEAVKDTVACLDEALNTLDAAMKRCDYLEKEVNLLNNEKIVLLSEILNLRDALTVLIAR